MNNFDREGLPPSIDQLVIREYFASDRYFRQQQKPDRRTFKRPPGKRWAEKTFLVEDADDESNTGFGFWGLAAIMYAIGMTFPYSVWAMIYSPAQWIYLLAAQISFGSLLSAFALFFFVCGYWAETILHRTLLSLAVGAMVIGLLTIRLSFFPSLTTGHEIGQYKFILMTFGMATMLSSMFLKTFLPWSFTSAAQDRTRDSIASIRAMLGITVVAAIGFVSASLAVDPDGNRLTASTSAVSFTEMAVCIVIAFFLTAAILVRCIAIQSLSRNIRWILNIAALALIFVAMFSISIYAAVRFEDVSGWPSSNPYFLTFMFAVIGTLINASIINRGLRWLQACGWQCLDNRQFIQQLSDLKLSDPT